MPYRKGVEHTSDTDIFVDVGLKVQEIMDHVMKCNPTKRHQFLLYLLNMIVLETLGCEQKIEDEYMSQDYMH